MFIGDVVDEDVIIVEWFAAYKAFEAACDAAYLGYLLFAGCSN